MPELVTEQRAPQYLVAFREIEESCSQLNSPLRSSRATDARRTATSRASVRYLFRRSITGLQKSSNRRHLLPRLRASGRSPSPKHERPQVRGPCTLDVSPHQRGNDGIEVHGVVEVYEHVRDPVVASFARHCAQLFPQTAWGSVLAQRPEQRGAVCAMSRNWPLQLPCPYLFMDGVYLAFKRH